MTHLRSFSMPQILFVAFLAALGVWFMSDVAFAQAFSGPVGSAGNFSCNGTSATGHLYDSGASCPTTITKNNIFSFLVCNMEQLSSNLMGQMFCGMVSALTPAVMSVLVLSVLFFGISFTIGIIPMQAKEFLVYLIKFACVFVFATKSDYLIGVAYKTLITGMRDGVAIAVSALFNDSQANGYASGSGSGMYGHLDAILGKAMSFATDYISTPNDGNHNADMCKNAVFAGLAIMAIVFPPLFYIALMIVFKVALTFLRAVFGYVYALVGIAFLLTLAPFFLSFYLFQSTRPFFERWIGYLISFSLQMVLVFSFLSFVLSIDIRHISDSLPGIVMYNADAKETTAYRLPWQYCTLCKFKVVSKDNPNGEPMKANDPNFISKGKMVCADNPPKPIEIGDELSPIPKKDSSGQLIGKNGGPVSETNPQAYEMPSNSTALNNLFTFATKGLMSLFVLAYLVDALLTYSAAIAQILASAGAAYAPQLGGGFSRAAKFDVPGIEIIESAEKRFTAAYSKENNAISATSAGLKKAFEGMVLGDRQSDGTIKEGTGMFGTFAQWLSDPKNHQ